jgi:hypothetical protein
VNSFIASLIAGLLVEMAKSAGHEAGIRAVAALGPYLSAEQVGRLWIEVVGYARNFAEMHPPQNIERLLGASDHGFEQPPLPALPFRPEMDEVTERYPLKEKGPG